MLDLPGVAGGGTLGKNKAEQERPCPAAQAVTKSGKDRAYKAGRRKSHGAGRESEGFILPVKACSKTRWREGTLLGSRLEKGKREGVPVTANNLFEKARELPSQTMDVCQVRSVPMSSGEGLHRRSDDSPKGLIIRVLGWYARHVRKAIGKPCAGKRHARFERGSLETGWSNPVPR